MHVNRIAFRAAGHAMPFGSNDIKEEPQHLATIVLVKLFLGCSKDLSLSLVTFSNDNNLVPLLSW